MLKCSFAQAPLSSKSPVRVGNSDKLMSQGNHPLANPPLALLVPTPFIPGGIEQLPHSLHLQIPACSFLLSLTRRCSEGAWKQGRGSKMWLLAKSLESKYRQGVFCHVLDIDTPVAPPCLSLLPFHRKYLGCSRSRREKLGCGWILDWYLPDLPSAIQRASSGPLGIRRFLSRDKFNQFTGTLSPSWNITSEIFQLRETP